MCEDLGLIPRTSKKKKSLNKVLLAEFFRTHLKVNQLINHISLKVAILFFTDHTPMSALGHWISANPI